MKKNIKIIAILLSLTFILTACHIRGEDSNALKISVFNGGYGIKWVSEEAKAYEAKTGTSVNIVDYYGEAGKTAMDSELQSKTSKTDIFFTLTHYLNFVRSGKINIGQQSYDCLLSDLSDVYESASDNNVKIKDKMLDSYQEYFNYNGKYYAMPWSIGAQGLLYHKDVFSEFNFKVPNTTEELLKLADDIKTANVTNKKWAVSEKEQKTIYPFCFSLNDEYWSYLFPVWFAQYEGSEKWADYWNCIGSDGEQYSETFTTAYPGILETLKVYEKLLDYSKKYNNPASYAANNSFTQSQFIFLEKESAMMVNGDWINMEMSGNYSEDEWDVAYMKVPVISSIIKQCTSVSDDAELSAVIAAIDSGSSALSGTGYDVTQEDFDKIYDARNMVPANGHLQDALVPSYSSKIDKAKDFLKFLYSDEGIRIYTNNTSGNGLPVKFDYLNDSGVKNSVGSFVRSEYEYISGKSFTFDYNQKNSVFSVGSLDFVTGENGDYIRKLAAQSATDYPRFKLGDTSYSGADAVYYSSVKYLRDNWTSKYLASVGK